MINGTWLLLLLGSFTSVRCLLPSGPSIIALSVVVWSHRANNSGVPLVGQLFNRVHIHCDKEAGILRVFYDLKRHLFGVTTSFWTVTNHCRHLG